MVLSHSSSNDSDQLNAKTLAKLIEIVRVEHTLKILKIRSYLFLQTLQS